MGCSYSKRAVRSSNGAELARRPGAKKIWFAGQGRYWTAKSGRAGRGLSLSVFTQGRKTCRTSLGQALSLPRNACTRIRHANAHTSRDQGASGGPRSIPKHERHGEMYDELARLEEALRKATGADYAHVGSQKVARVPRPPLLENGQFVFVNRIADDGGRRRACARSGADLLRPRRIATVDPLA